MADRFGFNPKKSGPDHAVPVIFLAMAESERYRVPCQEKPSSSAPADVETEMAEEEASGMAGPVHASPSDRQPYSV